MSDKRLEKITIHSYKNNTFNKKDKGVIFKIPINPESYKRNCKVELDTRKGHGSAANKSKFKSKGNEEFQFEFILDGTKTLSGYNNQLKDKPVKKQLGAFLKCVYDIDGNIHKPRFLIIFWGKDFKFTCQLSKLDINYTLFEPDGSPLRIKINATFINYLTPEASAAVNRLSSPDLTHYHTTEADERLDNLSYKFYNNSQYISQLARINELTSLRNLQPGTTMVFPPFDKNEN